MEKQTMDLGDIRLAYDPDVISPEKTEIKRKVQIAAACIGSLAAILAVLAVATTMEGAGSGLWILKLIALCTALVFASLGITACALQAGAKAAYHGPKPQCADVFASLFPYREVQIIRIGGRCCLFCLSRDGARTEALETFLGRDGMGAKEREQITKTLMEHPEAKLSVTHDGCGLSVITVENMDPVAQLVQKLESLEPEPVWASIGCPIAAVDFDGVLASPKWPGLGEPNVPLMAELSRLRSEGGLKLILWTNRNGQRLEDALNLCRDHGLIFDAVNENLPEILELVRLKDSRKVSADIFIDDKAFYYEFEK